MAEELSKAGFSGRVIDSSSADFAAASHRFSAISEARAQYIAFPRTSEDVSIAIVYATRVKLRVAIKCGGHHASGANSVEDGLVIDLSELRSVALNNDRSEVTVGGGCLWEGVYTFLRNEGLACIGGGVHNVGVGGHVTGGGYGPLTQKYGMACDNLISATVVLADGRIVTASDTENSDLLWGIKGGSSNFGVVVEFVLKTVPDPGSWVFRSIALPSSDLPTITPRFVVSVQWARFQLDVVLVFLNFVRGPHNTPLVILNFTLCGSGDLFSGLFEFFLGGLSPLSDITTSYPSLVELSHALDRLLLAGPRRIATGSVPVVDISPKLVHELWQRWLEYTDSNLDVVSTKVVFELHRTIRLRAEASCLRITEPVHNMILISEEHNEAKNDALALNWVHETTQLTRQRQTHDWGTDFGVWANASMRNETAADCWGLNYPRLQVLKAKYDPTSVFNCFLPIEPTK
ncbi:hypothetical protein BGZ61DRAFT_500573 [Ilyonectria robusta]|uniref:uncharacterized protein n=1 Tax=Ilyonectria robusta TaxID=1079257 RepID=UPI001E8EEA4C|nr:uncharacterized protein BGZ61DRAFT_500573 [Ilyonectria robusta]KAH8654337.1 hypothetical protein BGZ61DRAFT_500573 [Ilyonectria robusta]